MNKKYLLTFIIVLASAVIIAGGFIYINREKTAGLNKEKTLSSQEAAQKALDYINNVLQGRATASLTEISEGNGVYKINLKIGEEKYEFYVTKNGKLLFTEGIDLESSLQITQTPETQGTSTIGNFFVSEDEICEEADKPTIYFFGSSGCTHCKWEHPIVENVAKNFEEYISFHNNMDADTDMDVFSKYSTGGIPTLVFGCKYYRVGSGEQSGEKEESEILTALICKLTQNQPTEVCDKVRDLVNQITD